MLSHTMFILSLSLSAELLVENSTLLEVRQHCNTENSVGSR